MVSSESVVRVDRAAPDRRLVARALADDRTALAALAAQLAPVIQARIARVLRRRSLADQPRCALDDLTQEVFVRLLAANRRALRAWDPARGLSLASFVGLIAEREAANALESQRRTPRCDRLELRDDIDELGRGEPTPERLHIARDLLVKLHGRLAAWLSPRGRELFELLYLREEPLARVAEQLAMPPSAVYAWRNRLARRARALLAELG